MTSKQKLDLAVKAINVAIVRLKEIQYQKASHKQVDFLNRVLRKIHGKNCFYCAGSGIQVQNEEELDFKVPDPKAPCIHCDGLGYVEDETEDDRETAGNEHP